MRVLLVSALPDVATLCGLSDHYPLAADAGDGRWSRIAAKDAAHGPGTFDASAYDVAHITGTSGAALAVAERLAAAGVPFLYSPMLPALPTMAERIFGALTGTASDVRADLAVAERIASKAAGVVFTEGRAGAWLTRRPGFAGSKAFAVPAPGLRVPVPGKQPASNLAAVFCDAVSPEWNVFRLVQAFEKINADAVILAGPTDSPYARECARLAAANPRVRVVGFDRGIPAVATAEAGTLLANASVIVDPSPRGLAGAIVAAAHRNGTPAVVSRFSTLLRKPGGAVAPPAGLFGFEPSSWELLNHAIVMAFNRATGADGAKAETGERAASDGEIARRLREMYAEVVAMTGAAPGDLTDAG